MLRWLRDKLSGPVYLDCYTDSHHVYEHAKIKAANKFRPEWLEKLPVFREVTLEDNPNVAYTENTMRLCVGVTDFYKKALCVPLWTDLTIHVGHVGTDRYDWRSSVSNCQITVHPQQQRGTFLPALEYQHLKITGPWVIHCDEDVSFLLMDPFWGGGPYNERAFVPPGIINFKYQGSTNINMFVPRPLTGDKKITLKYNDPIAILIPLTERKVVMRYHLVTKEEKLRYELPHLVFSGAYYAARKSKIDAEKEAKCPMRSK